MEGRIKWELDFVYITTDKNRFLKKEDAQKHQDKLNKGERRYEIFDR
tara:strand:+ start:455 stop:595 length:141 start_codon:yes stop_codon:yes gene_type:complete